MQPEIVHKNLFQRMAGGSFIVGAIVLSMSSILFPRVGDPGNTEQFLMKVAETRGGLWELDHVLFILGFWGFMIGIGGVYQSITGERAATWAGLGFYGALVATILFTILFVVVGLALPRLVVEWENAAGTDKATLQLIASSMGDMGGAVFGLTIIVYWLALAFLGIGMVFSTVYPKWLGWSIIAPAFATVVLVGIPQTFAGASHTVNNVIFPILSIPSILWATSLGVWLVAGRSKGAGIGTTSRRVGLSSCVVRLLRVGQRSSGS